MFQCFTKILSTFISYSVSAKVDFFERLKLIKKWIFISTNNLVGCYCIVLQGFTYMSSIFRFNFVMTEVELCKCLRKIKKWDAVGVKGVIIIGRS
jgi:hypothetical protein